MRFLAINFILLFYFSLIFSQESWNTNIFDYSWNKISKRMIFREPIVFSPFEIRAGYFHYGGEDYLKNLSLFGNDISQHPVELDSTHLSYNGLIDIKDRKGLFIELDIAKTNLLLYLLPQNFIDIQFGLGYRMSHMLNQPDLPKDIIYTNPDGYWDEYKFSPKIHDFNFNTTLNWQINESFIPYFYHSIGLSKIALYNTEANKKYLYGNAISETFSMGLKKIIKNQNRYSRYNLYYGGEIKTVRTTTLNLEDPNNFSPITGFDMRGISCNLTFGVIFGGKRTIGDEAFAMMIENNFESAIPVFEDYIENYPKHGRVKKAQKMLEFCNSQLPYQKFKKGMSQLNEKDLDEAVRFFDEAYADADEELKLEINFKREQLAQQIVDYVNSNFDLISMKKSEDLLNKARAISNSVSDEVNLLKGDLYFKRATLLHESNLLNDALEHYQLALTYNSDLEISVNSRLMLLANNILENSQRYHANNEYILAIESLNKAIQILPELSDRLSPTINKFEDIIEDLNEIKTKEAISNVIDDSKYKNRSKEQLVIGMLKDKIIEIMGMPDQIKFLDSSLSSFEVWSYSKLEKKLYIKDEKLYQIQLIEGE